MVISKPDTTPNGAAGGVGAGPTTESAAPGGLDGTGNSPAHPSGIPQDQIDNIMSSIHNTGNVKMNNHRKKLRQRFDIIKKLGQGTYGKVQLGINKETGQEVAIKTIKKCKIEAEADLVRIRREVQIMSSVYHPNIIHIYEVFENREKMVLVMEFAAGGELYDYLSERKVLSEEEARRIFRQVATAVYYCHKHKICHRDLKLENILLDEKGNAKIADFGLSNVFDDQRLLGTFCGSPLYASPEIVEGTPYQGPEVDCWSLGVLLYTLVYGSMPFDGSNFKRLVKQISQGDYYEPRKPSRASTLIRDMLTVCPKKRATIEQICSHWWVNENDNVSCLDLAEDLANQTPVRLDVLLSLTPSAITPDQLVVPSADGVAAAKAAANERVPRSHSVGSIRDMGPPNTEAERRILDMVAAGGEAALMPSPTRTITPAQSPVQTKRKLQPTVSMENAAGTTAKKEKPANSSFVIRVAPAQAAPLTDVSQAIVIHQDSLMEADPIGHTSDEPGAAPSYSQKDMQMVGDLCEQLIGSGVGKPNIPSTMTPPGPSAVARQATRGKLDAVAEIPEEKDATKVIKKFVNKHKTADLVNAINECASKAGQPAGGAVLPPPFVRKCSLQDESTLNNFNVERRKSRILETAEKFQPPPPVTLTADKPKKLSIPGVSVGSFKKEFERKAINPQATGSPTPGELRAQEQVAAAAAAAQEAEALATPPASPVVASQSLEGSDSKNSVSSLSLDEARRSMENSIALLLQAQNESSKEVDQLCAQTETIGVNEPLTLEDRERKLKNARAIIGNAIQPASPGGAEGQPTPPAAVKTSTASITLKSATLPRRKINAKAEVQLDIKPRILEQSAMPQPAMRFSTEMQHPVSDLRSAPPREGPVPYSPIKTTLQVRATSLEPKEHVITIQRPPTQQAYGRSGSNTTTRSSSLSRQSTVESESDATTTVTNMSQATVPSQGTSQPIKKSPREFIIPIAVEGGGFVTPRERSVEPSELSHTTSSRSTFSRLRPSRRISSLLSEAGFEEGSPFQKMRTTSITRDGGSAGAEEEARLTPHRLRSSRPVKKISQDNDSQSSNEEDEDDDDGFEILTAENLFSTLLQRVRALTNRLNVNSDLPVGFPSHSSRLLTDISRQAHSHSPFWTQGGPFTSVQRSQISYTFSETVEKKKVRLNSSSNSTGLGAPWRHSMSRELGSDMESMFTRTGATLPRGHQGSIGKPSSAPCHVERVITEPKTISANSEEPLDLADLDLSRLKLSKKDLATLSSITPGLPKCFQEQLLAKLPPTQARKLSRTLSVQTGAPSSSSTPKSYKRSQSGGRDYIPDHQQQQNDLLDFRSKTDAPKTTSASTAIYRRSLSRSKTPAQASAQEMESRSTQSTKSRSSSVCRDDHGKSSLCSSSTYTSEISDKYKYYSPYLSKSSNVSPSIAPTDAQEKGYSGGLRRPPSGCLSPPPQLPQVPASEGTSSLRIGRSSQRRISRFLRPDFFDDSRDRETQTMLREIREKSIDRHDQGQLQSQDMRRRKHSLPNVEQTEPPLEQESIRSSMRHSRNKSMELFPDLQPQLAQHPIKPSSLRLRSSSRSRPPETELDNHELADKILQELQLLSAARTQSDQAKDSEKTEQTSTIRKSKKVKPKETTASEAEVAKISTETTSTTTTMVRKVKKLAKKADESTKITNMNNSDLGSCAPKETKLKRPKSYPMKDFATSIKTPADLAEQTSSILPSKMSSKLPSVVTNDSVSTEGATRDSRLMRPKSYPATKLAIPKELRKGTRSGVTIPTIAETTVKTTPTSAKSTSEENSESVTPTGTVMTAMDAKDVGTSSSDSRPTTIKKIIKVSKKSKLVPPLPVTPTTPTTTATTTPVDSSKESSPVIKMKEKSPEKKSTKGLLYALGQKFERLRDSAMSKEKKLGSTEAAASLACAQKQGSSECRMSPEKSNKKVLDTGNLELEVAPTEDKRLDKRSRFDNMLRSLRERSVPRSQPNGRIMRPKRAASNEELHAGSQATQGKQGGAVNKMFGGLLRRFDREISEQRRVRSTRSTSNIERQVQEEQDQQRDVLLPTSPIYQNVGKATKANIAPLPLQTNEENCNCETACPDCSQNTRQSIQTCSNTPPSAMTIKKEKRKGLMLDLASANGSSNAAPGELSPPPATTCGSSYRGTKTNPALLNGNSGLGIYSNLPPYPGAIKSASSNNSSSQQSTENATNNNSTNTNQNSSSLTSGYRTSSAHEINRNNTLLTPSFENIATCSSDSHSCQDECASTSTFLSPTEEPELYFDNWSICSEDNFMLHATPSPTVSRLSRASLSSPTRCSESSDPNESVIDRIKRRSFYSRFNEQKKPRRTSSIVGPSAVRDYYREQQAAVKARSSHKLHSTDLDPPPIRAHSPDIAQQFFRPLKLSPVGTELKPPVYRSPLDYSSPSAGATSKPRQSLNDIRNTSPSFLSKRYETHDYSSVPMRYKTSSSSSPSNGAITSGYYNTYNPKRRSSYTINGSMTTTTSTSSGTASSQLDGYATMGRRSIRAYGQRTMSLLEPSTASSRSGEGTSSYQRRETRTPVRDYTSSISRS
ncbi:hypothetical protein KR038_009044, partial [Drosophila bunnanda]